MRLIKFICAAAILFTSCRASRNIVTAPNDETEIKPTIAVAVSANKNTNAPASDLPQATVIENDSLEVTKANELTEMAGETTKVATAKKRITSFNQMKEMARSGEIAMSKKDLKTLNRLEKHYKGNYEQFRADTFELTNKAKIIGGIGLLGLLLAIITGSAFGWFLFVVAVLAFLLRYLNIIAF